MAIAVVLALLFDLSYLVPIYGEICGKNEYTGHKECTPYHIGPFLLVGIVSVIDDHNGLVTAIATIVIGAFTIILARATIGLERLGRKQAEDTRTSLRISLRAANASRSTVEAMEKNARTQLRA